MFSRENAPKAEFPKKEAKETATKTPFISFAIDKYPCSSANNGVPATRLYAHLFGQVLAVDRHRLTKARRLQSLAHRWEKGFADRVKVVIVYRLNAISAFQEIA